MNPTSRLLLFATGLILVFGLMFLAGRALVPESTVATWTRQAEESSAAHEETMAPELHTGGSHEGAEAGGPAIGGLSLEEDGYRLGPIEAPEQAGKPGELSFRVYGPEGKPLTDFAVAHEKQLHLIAVRSDGSGFQHLHPEPDNPTGNWSVPVTWPRGGTYRVFTDFTPAGEPGRNLVLGRNTEVAGKVTPVPRPLSSRDTVDGFSVSIDGKFEAGESEPLTVTVTRGGQPETRLQPYLGAYGHLVALREGDLAYLHVHAEAGPEEHGSDEGGHSHAEPEAGPEIRFVAEPPTPGRYLLYLDFKVEDRVHTAEFVLEAK